MGIWRLEGLERIEKKSPSKDRAIHCLANSNTCTAKSGSNYHPNHSKGNQLKNFVTF